MIRKIFTIAFLYLKNTYTSRATFIFSILMPLLFTFVLGTAMDGAFSEDSPPTSWQLVIVDQDQTEWSARLIARLEADPVVDVQPASIKDALTLVDEKDAPAAVLIPAGFGDALGAGGSVELRFFQHPESLARAQILQAAVNAASAELTGSIVAADMTVRIAQLVGTLDGGQQSERDAYYQTAFAAAEDAWANTAPVTVDVQSVTRLSDAPQIPIGSSQSAPGMLVMYALFFTLGGGASIVIEREAGTLRRLLVMPMKKGVILAGKLVGTFIGALVQMAILVLAGKYLFGVSWGQSPTGLVVMLLAFGFAATSLGMAFAAIVKTSAQANAMSTLIVMGMASLGGAWWPIEIVPQWMQQLALALPSGWAMRGLHDIITRGLGAQAVLLEAGVLLAMGAVFLLFGVARFKYE